MAFSGIVLNNPVASSLPDLVTTQQLQMIRANGRYKGINTDELCMELLKCHVSELSKMAANELIQHLLETK